MTAISFGRVRRDRRPANSSERYVVAVSLSRIISLYLTYVLLRLRLTADSITYANLLVSLGAAALFVTGYPLWGAVGFAAVQVLDCSDGEMARVTGTTDYGSTLDSLGADLFYAVGPSSVGYYLFSVDVTVGSLPPYMVLVAGVVASLSFLVYRLVDVKVNAVINGRRANGKAGVAAAEETAQRSMSQRMLGTYRNWVFRQNFFAEPGLILIVLVLTSMGLWEALAGYLMVLAGYTIPNVALSMARARKHFSKELAPG
jgi:phosphatidylglycerophosphate synthase